MPSILYKWAEEYLRGRLRDGQRIQLNPPHTARDVPALIASNFDWQVLCDLLFKRPRLIGHPVVWTLVSHLQHRMNTSDPLTSHSALFQLKDVLASWISGLLPGWTICPPKRRGRKVDVSEQFVREQLLWDYEQLLSYLRKKKLRSHAEIVKVSHQIWKRLGSYVCLSRKGSEKAWTTVKVSLPQHLVDSWATDAMNRIKDLATVPDFLAYTLLAHRDGKTYNQLRHIIAGERRKWASLRKK